MSYDLMVFEPEAAPLDYESFLTWYHDQTEWSEDHGYDNPEVLSPRLLAWFMDMIRTFPAMNGPYAPSSDPEDDAATADYCSGKSIIYVAFAWSKAEAAYSAVFDLARRHGVGFFDASGSDGRVYLPDGQGELKLMFSKPPSDAPEFKVEDWTGNAASFVNIESAVDAVIGIFKGRKS